MQLCVVCSLVGVSSESESPTCRGAGPAPSTALSSPVGPERMWHAGTCGYLYMRLTAVCLVSVKSSMNLCPRDLPK